MKVVPGGVIHTPMSRSVKPSTTEASRSDLICSITSGIADEGEMKESVVAAAYAASSNFDWGEQRNQSMQGSRRQSRLPGVQIALRR